MVAVEWPAASAMANPLRQAYATRRVTITAFKSLNLESSCGWYRLDDNPATWRYLNEREGLWAEELSKEWRTPSLYPAASADLDQRWGYCMSRSGRGHALDWLTAPITVALLNLR